MKIKFFGNHVLPLVILAVSCWLLAIPAVGQTLNQALAAAYHNNPGLLAARANLQAKDETVPQALASWRPNVSMSADIARSHTHLNTRTANRDQLQSPRNTSIDVTQPLFKGFRTLAGVEKAELGVKSTRATLIAKEQDVLLSACLLYTSDAADE